MSPHYITCIGLGAISDYLVPGPLKQLSPALATGTENLNMTRHHGKGVESGMQTTTGSLLAHHVQHADQSTDAMFA